MQPLSHSFAACSLFPQVVLILLKYFVTPLLQLHLHGSCYSYQNPPGFLVCVCGKGRKYSTFCASPITEFKANQPNLVSLNAYSISHAERAFPLHRAITSGSEMWLPLGWNTAG